METEPIRLKMEAKQREREPKAQALAAQDALGFSRLVVRQLQPTASSSPDLPERPQ